MEQFNKIISFALGLAVVIIFLAVATGRINLKGKLPILSSSSSSKTISVTPIPGRKVTVAPLNPTSIAGGSRTKGGTIVSPTPSAAYHSYSSPGAVSTIPSTGPELLFPIAIAAFAGGAFLRKTGKK